MALGCCGATRQSPEEPQAFLPLNGLPPKAIEQLILPAPSTLCKSGAEVRAASDDYVLQVDMLGDGSCWEAVSITGSFGRCTIRLCGRSAAPSSESRSSSSTFEEERKRSRQAFESEMRLRKGLGIDAMRVVCRLLGTDTTNHVLILELAEFTLETFLAQKRSSGGSSGNGNGGSGLRVVNRWSEADAPRVLAAQQESAAKELLPLLLPVATLHKHSLVAADLALSSFVRRADGSWRLLEVASCKRLGKRVGELPPAAVAFTCPEIAASLKSGQPLPMAKRAMDLWSLGLIFFSAMRQGARLLDGPDGELHTLALLRECLECAAETPPIPHAVPPCCHYRPSPHALTPTLVLASLLSRLSSFSSSLADYVINLLAGDERKLKELIEQRLVEIDSPYHEIIAGMLDLDSSQRRTADQLIHSLRILFPLQPLARHGSISL